MNRQDFTPPSDSVVSDHPSASRELSLRILYLKVFAVFVTLFALGLGAVFWADQAEVEAHKREAVEAASLHGHLLQQQLVRSLSATYALAAVMRQGHGEIHEFEELAKEMLVMYGGLSSLQLAPNGVISRIVPIQGNEAAIGHNLLGDPERNREAFLAMESRALTLAGPFELRQGGQAVVGRLPVFLDVQKPAEHFWGFVTAVVRIPDLLRASALGDDRSRGHEFVLTKMHPDRGDRQVIWASGKVVLDDPVSFRIAVPNGEWTLEVARVDSWHSPVTTLAWLGGAVLLISVLSAFLAYQVLRQPLRMSEEIEARTAALNESNESLKTEIFQHWQTELALREGEQRLERRVLERTHELEIANEALVAEKARQQELIDKLADTRSQLLQSQMMAAVGQLAAGVAHEINNPMGFISSNIGMMKTYVDALMDGLARQQTLLAPWLANYPELQEQLLMIEQDIDLPFIHDDFPPLIQDTLEGLVRVKRIVQDLREFSFVDRSEWQSVDLNRCIESTLGVMAGEFGERIVVAREFGDIPEIPCHPAQLSQVLRSLLLNALQAIEGQGQIKLTTRVIDSWVELSVADNGRGIAPEFVDRVFEPFFTAGTVGKGMGLGLSVAYHVVKRHCGDISVWSSLGNGSCFTVRLPIAQTAAVDSK